MSNYYKVLLALFGVSYSLSRNFKPFNSFISAKRMRFLDSWSCPVRLKSILIWIVEWVFWIHIFLPACLNLFLTKFGKFENKMECPNNACNFPSEYIPKKQILQEKITFTFGYLTVKIVSFEDSVAQYFYSIELSISLHSLHSRMFIIIYQLTLNLTRSVFPERGLSVLHWVKENVVDSVTTCVQHSSRLPSKFHIACNFIIVTCFH